jgi:ketosteroid isomerase-like protein
MTADEATLVAADDARLAALVRADLDALDAMLAEQLVFVHTGGRQDDKTSYVGSLRSGRLRYRSLTRRAVAARIAGDVGILTGTLAMEVTAHGTDRSADARFMTVWQRRDGAWLMLAADMALAQESATAR